MGLMYDQGIDFSENSGHWPMPEAHVGTLKVFDENDIQHCLVFDSEHGKFYDLSTKEAHSESGVIDIYKDLTDVDGTNGYDLEPEITFKEDTGEYEKFIVEHLSSRFYVRPLNETDRNLSGYGSNGYSTNLELTTEIYVDGEPTSYTVSAEDISKNGEIVYDKKVEGHRLQTKIKSTDPRFRLISRQQDYIAKDINYDFDNRVTTEGDHQLALLTPTMWFSRGETPTYDRVGGSGVVGSMGLCNGPDNKINSAFEISTQVRLPILSSTNQKTVIWMHDITDDVTVSVGSTVLTQIGRAHV
jgi:hypothetical protein